jgi:hypothetical protein
MNEVGIIDVVGAPVPIVRTDSELVPVQVMILMQKLKKSRPKIKTFRLFSAKIQN